MTSHSHLFEFCTPQWDSVPAVFVAYDRNVRGLFVGETINLRRSMSALTTVEAIAFVQAELIRDARCRYYRAAELAATFGVPSLNT